MKESDKEKFILALIRGDVIIDYKKKDGTQRTIKVAGIVPTDSSTVQIDEDKIRVYDTITESWKTVFFDNVVAYTVDGCTQVIEY